MPNVIGRSGRDPYIVPWVLAVEASFHIPRIPAACVACDGDRSGWALLRNGGHVILMRHAMAPGTGDPSNFDLENCRTQRNLSDRGRQQARRIGALFSARAEPVEKVLSSRWCRALDTARLAFGDRLVEPFPPSTPSSAQASPRRSSPGRSSTRSGTTADRGTW